MKDWSTISGLCGVGNVSATCGTKSARKDTTKNCEVFVRTGKYNAKCDAVCAKVRFAQKGGKGYR